MNDTELMESLYAAARKGKLMTDKHNPYMLSKPFPKDRTVLSYKVAQNVRKFILSGDYDPTYYHNTAYKNSPLFLVLTPTTPEFSIPASGVAACSTIPTSVCDVIIAVSGSMQGWHLYGGTAIDIAHLLSTGKLINRKALPNTLRQKANQRSINRRRHALRRRQQKRRRR